MAPEDLRTFIHLLEKRRELRRVRVEVDPHLEIAAIVDRVVKRTGAPALLFEQVKGSRIPLATQLFGSSGRMAAALGWDDLESAAAHLAGALAGVNGGGPEDRLRRIVEQPQNLPRFRENPPCREITEKADLRILPALHAWPGDGGRYLTLPLVFTGPPETGQPNCGMYRLQILDGGRGALHWRPGSGGAAHHAAWSGRGRRMPVAIALGGPPVLTWAASAPLPAAVDEVSLAGFLGREPVEMAACLTSDLQVPAAAEFILEGHVEPAETALEGPFGNHSGYYVAAAPRPVFHLQVLSRRRDPIYPCTVVGPPPRENYWLGKASERLLLPLLRLAVPEVSDLRFLPEGIFHGAALVAVAAAAGAKDLLRRLRCQPLLRGSRLLVLLDAGEDLENGSLILWRLLNQTDAGRDLLLEEGFLGIDGRSRELSRLGRVETDPATRALIDRRWPEYGLE